MLLLFQQLRRRNCNRAAFWSSRIGAVEPKESSEEIHEKSK